VVVAASEGRTNANISHSTALPDRFIGSANVRVCNIAPYDRGVEFVLQVDWDEDLPIWADIVLLDERPVGFSTSD
jgi:hypothetical protein